MACSPIWPCDTILSAAISCWRKNLRAEAVVGERRQGRHDLEIAEPCAEVALDAPQGDDGRSRNAGRCGEAIDQRAVLLQERAAAGDPLVRDDQREILVERHLEFGLVVREFHDPRDLLDRGERCIERARIDAGLERLGAQPAQPCRELGIGSLCPRRQRKKGSGREQDSSTDHGMRGNASEQRR